MMDNTSDPAGMRKPRDPLLLAPLAVLGAVALTVGLTAYRVRPSRRDAAGSIRKRHALIAYLRDHLSGSDVALRVVRQRLVPDAPGTDEETLFRWLFKEFEDDRAVVRTVLSQLGASERSIKRTAGVAVGSLLSLTSGGEPGDLSLFRTLEALSIGVQGKRCMWRALQSLRSLPPAIHGVTFVEMEAKAVRQWEEIEKRRRGLVDRTFSAVPEM